MKIGIVTKNLNIRQINKEECLTILNQYDKEEFEKVFIDSCLLGSKIPNDFYDFKFIKNLQLINCGLKHISMGILSLEFLQILIIKNNELSLLSTTWMKKLEELNAYGNDRITFYGTSHRIEFKNWCEKEDVLKFWKPLDDYRSAILCFIWGKPYGLPKDIALIIGKMAWKLFKF